MINFKTFLAEYEYNSLQFNVTGKLATKLINFGKSIPDELINTAAGGREKDPHISVKYGLIDHIDKNLINLLTGFGPVKVQLGPITRFENEGSDVLKVDVLGDDIIRLNKLVVSNVKCIDSRTEYHPHLTIAFMNRGTAEPYLLNRKFLGEKLSFDSIIFSTKDEIHITFYLT